MKESTCLFSADYIFGGMKMRNLNRTIALVLIMAITTVMFSSAMFTVSAGANTTDNINWQLYYSGDCGKSNNSVQWKYHTHQEQLSDPYYNNRFTLTAVSGLDGGIMENYVYKNDGFYSQYLSSGLRKWDSFFRNVYMLNIEEGMKSIGDHAFNFAIYFHGISDNLIPYPQDVNTKVRYFNLPSTIEEIGFNAFAGALKYVDTLTIPANLSTLDVGSFCSNGFKKIIIEEGNLSTIPLFAFANCNQLEEIYIPKTVKVIDSSAFMGCSSLKKIYYGGYEEDWENIVINYGNDALLSAQISFPIRVHVSSVSLDVTRKNLLLGNSLSLTATVLPQNADVPDVEWLSSNTKVATVSESGVVTAVSSGTATISAITVDGGLKATCQISVQNVPVESIVLDKQSVNVHIGTCETLVPIITPSLAITNISWISSDANIATVENGVIQGGSPGSTIVTATTDDKGKSAMCTVTVEGHIGGVATCQNKAECEVCHQKYGDKNSSYHTVSAEWVQTEKHHSYSHPCCGTEMITNELHTWSNGTCSKCNYKCMHSYDNACDTSCNVCGATREIIHDYASATCTAPKTCKVCGVTQGSALGHSYTNACDKYCNICNTQRSVPDHVYANACDTSCNVCGVIREITHDYVSATCMVPKICKVCGATQGEVLGHIYDDEQGECIRCGEKDPEYQQPGEPSEPDVPSKPETPTDIPVSGDLNGDTKIDAKDALVTLKFAVGKQALSDEQKAAADVNKDGNINAKDALEMLKYAVGKPSVLDQIA